MLNPFPTQFLALFAYFLLRVTVGAVLLYLGIRHYKNRKELTTSKLPGGSFTIIALTLAEILIGGFLIVGAHTQYAALALMCLSGAMLLLRNRYNHALLPPKIFYVLLFGTALSLFITGAGALAFDLPI